MDIIKDMHERGQNIGLHFALNGMTDMEQIRKRIRMEIDILSEMFGFPITEFSVHRPSKDVLRENIKLDGVLNAYQDEFFTFADKITDDTKLGVKYMSDANHIWRYGYPDEANITGFDKVQILVHPFAWSKAGAIILKITERYCRKSMWNWWNPWITNARISASIKSILWARM